MNVGLLDKVTPLKPHHFWSVQVPEVIKQWASNSLSLIFCLVSEYKFWSANRDGSTIRDLAGWNPHFKSPRSRNMLTVISMGLYIPLMVHNSSCFFSQVVIFLFEETVKSPDQDLKRSFIIWASRRWRNAPWRRLTQGVYMGVWFVRLSFDFCCG